MAAGRDRRGNAGSKMAKLLNEEEEDDFYKTTYGGFEEVEDDRDYQSEDSDSDRVDSDFDIDENAEPEAEDDDEEEGKRKRRGGGVDTKAYKEPKKEKAAPEAKKKKKKKIGKGEAETKDVKTEEKKTSAGGRRKRRNETEAAKVDAEVDAGPARKKVRATTSLKSAASGRRKKEEEIRKKMMSDLASRKNVSAVRRLTQEELLEEAKETEKQNLISLHEFQKLELEKKKAARFTKLIRTGPQILFHSMTMPIVELQDPSRPPTPPSTEPPAETIPAPAEAPPDRTTSNPDADPSAPDSAEPKGEGTESTAATAKKKLLPEQSCERSFVTFTDLASFKRAFPDHYYKMKGRSRTQNRIPERKYCPITGMLAKYFDPVTQTPYANLRAFKMIRETMHKQLEKQQKNEEKKAEEKKKGSSSSKASTPSRTATES